MFNTQLNNQFNKNTLAQSFDSDRWIVEFNWYDLTSYCKSGKYGTLILTGGWEHSTAPDIESYVSSIVDWGGVVNKKYGNKTINFSLFIQWESNDDLILKIDELKRRTQGSEWELLIKVRGVYRLYTATLSSIIFPSIPAQEDYIEWVSISFLITSGTWEEYESTSSVFDVSWETETIIKNTGSYEAMPVFSVSCKETWNSMTSLNINIRDLGATGWNDVYINQIITNNDLIVFNYKESIVTLNGIEIPFFNPMTPMNIGNQVITITPTGTINAELTISYNRTYI